MIKLLHLVFSTSGLSFRAQGPQMPRASSRIGAVLAVLCFDHPPESGSQQSSEQAELDLCSRLKAEGSQRLGFQVWNLEKSPAPSSCFCEGLAFLSCLARKRSTHPQGAGRLACFPHRWAQPGRWSEPIFKVDTHLGRACGESQIPFIYKVTSRDSVSRPTWILFQQEKTV